MSITKFGPAKTTVIINNIFFEMVSQGIQVPFIESFICMIIIVCLEKVQNNLSVHFWA